VKTLIVFLAMLIVLSSFLVFVEDSDNYLKLQKSLKALAEECAAGGALFFDDSSTEDQYIVDIESANEYANYIVSNYRTTLRCLSSSCGEITVSTSAFINSRGNTCTRSVCVWKPINGYRLFRLTFLKTPEYTEEVSVYEIKR